MKKFLVLLCSIVMIFGMVCTSQANGLPLEWSFTNTPITVSPTDTIDLLAEITNVSASDFSDNLFLVGYGIGTTGLAYTINLNFSLFTDWDPLDLAPGESRDFRFATLTPHGGSAPVGTYSNNSATLAFDSTPAIDSMNLFEVTVVSAAPEPATMLLIVTGLVGLVGIRRKFKA